MTENSLLPDNKSSLERGYELAFSGELYSIQNPFPALLQSDTAPAHTLAHLAQDRGVNEWDATASEAERRGVVKTAIPQYRLAGTPKGLKLAVEPLSGDIDVIPWHKYGGEPYHMRVIAWMPAAPTEDLLNRVFKRIALAQSERDVIALSLGIKGGCKTYFGGAYQCAPRFIVGPWQPPEFSGSATLYSGGAVIISHQVTIT
uniref:Putative tail protein n=1 Tax=viral metagenome TaxID=1070528 RepID=A0A6M3J2X1_9ZZZZ